MRVSAAWRATATQISLKHQHDEPFAKIRCSSRSGWPYNREQATSASGASTCRKAQHVSGRLAAVEPAIDAVPTKKDRSTTHCRATYTVCVASARSQVSEAAAAADHRRQLEARPAAGVVLGQVDVEEVHPGRGRDCRRQKTVAIIVPPICAPFEKVTIRQGSSGLSAL